MSAEMREAAEAMAAGIEAARAPPSNALAADDEAALLRVISRAIRNAREIDLTEDDADRLAWIIYNSMIDRGYSIR